MPCLLGLTLIDVAKYPKGNSCFEKQTAKKFLNSQRSVGWEDFRCPSLKFQQYLSWKKCLLHPAELSAIHFTVVIKTIVFT